MREAPPEYEWRRDNLAERRGKPCLIYQFGSSHLSDVPDARRRAHHLGLQRLEEDYRTRLVHLHIGSRISLDHDQRDAWIAGPAIEIATGVLKPGFPRFLIELPDAVPVFRDPRYAGDRHPLVSAVVVVRAVDVRIDGQLVELVCLGIGDEPQVSPFDPVLSRHRP